MKLSKRLQTSLIFFFGFCQILRSLVVRPLAPELCMWCGTPLVAGEQHICGGRDVTENDNEDDISDRQRLAKSCYSLANLDQAYCAVSRLASAIFQAERAAVRRLSQRPREIFFRLPGVRHPPELVLLLHCLRTVHLSAQAAGSSSGF